MGNAKIAHMKHWADYRKRSNCLGHHPLDKSVSVDWKSCESLWKISRAARYRSCESHEGNRRAAGNPGQLESERSLGRAPPIPSNAAVLPTAIDACAKSVLEEANGHRSHYGCVRWASGIASTNGRHPPNHVDASDVMGRAEIPTVGIEEEIQEARELGTLDP